MTCEKQNAISFTSSSHDLQASTDLVKPGDEGYRNPLGFSSPWQLTLPFSIHPRSFSPKNRQTNDAHLWYKTSNGSVGERFHRGGIEKEQMSDTFHESHGFPSHDSFATRYSRLIVQKSFKSMRDNNSNVPISPIFSFNTFGDTKLAVVLTVPQLHY